MGFGYSELWPGFGGQPLGNGNQYRQPYPGHNLAPGFWHDRICRNKETIYPVNSLCWVSCLFNPTSADEQKTPLIRLARFPHKSLPIHPNQFFQDIKLFSLLN